MGTVQVIYVEDRTIAHAWPEVTSVTWPEEAMSGSMFCACATGSCTISALVGPFSPEVTKSRDRKRPCPALPFSRTFFSVLFSSIFPRTPHRIFFPYFFLYSFPRIFSPVLFSRTFSEMLEFISFGFFLILFYLEHKDTPILEDYINDTLKDDRNRSWRVILFALKPKRGLKCFIAPTKPFPADYPIRL